jgi:hypothetical protein
VQEAASRRRGGTGLPAHPWNQRSLSALIALINVYGA